MKFGHAPGGRFFLVSEKRRRKYILEGKKVKLRSRSTPNSLVCPLCRNPFSQMRKHLKNFHKLNNAERQKLNNRTKQNKNSTSQEDDQILKKFGGYLDNRASGYSTKIDHEVSSIREETMMVMTDVMGN